MTLADLPTPALVLERPVLRASRAAWPFIERAFADAGYAGERMAKVRRVVVEIVLLRRAARC